MEEHYQVELNALEPRLEQLYGYALDAGVNPYGPTAIFRVFMTALESVIKSNKVRHIAYLTLRESMLDPLGTLYQRLDEILPKSQSAYRGRAMHDARASGSGAGAPAEGIADGAEAADLGLEPGYGGAHAGGGYAPNRGATGGGAAAGTPLQGSGTTMGRMAQALMGLFRRNRPPVPLPAPRKWICPTCLRDGAQFAPGRQSNQSQVLRQS